TVQVVDADRERAGVDDLDRARGQLLDRADIEFGHALLQVEVGGGAGPLLRQRGPLCLVQRELERREAEQRALQAYRRERDADLVQQVVARQRRDLLRTSS